MYRVQIPNLPRSVGLSANGFLYSGGSGGVKKARPGGAYEGTAPPAPNPARIDAPWCAGGLQSRNSKCETLCFFLLSWYFFIGMLRFFIGMCQEFSLIKSESEFYVTFYFLYWTRNSKRISSKKYSLSLCCFYSLIFVL